MIAIHTHQAQGHTVSVVLDELGLPFCTQLSEARPNV